MRYILTIKADNAAFGETEVDRSWEVARILKVLAERLEQEGEHNASDPLLDFNGNTVGSLTFTED